jgi:hypothetical protein
MVANSIEVIKTHLFTGFFEAPVTAELNFKEGGRGGRGGGEGGGEGGGRGRRGERGICRDPHNCYNRCGARNTMSVVPADENILYSSEKVVYFLNAKMLLTSKKVR